tara:strand:- start:4656 stop:4916 length:261 start_codon:yes stop_codon:yes gene_type:complete
MKKITINTHQELLAFIKRDEVTNKQATEVVCKCLHVFNFFEKTKEEVIRDTEHLIQVWIIEHPEWERPFCLGQIGEHFEITDLGNN